MPWPVSAGVGWGVDGLTPKSTNKTYRTLISDWIDLFYLALLAGPVLEVGRVNIDNEKLPKFWNFSFFCKILSRKLTKYKIWSSWNFSGNYIFNYFSAKNLKSLKLCEALSLGPTTRDPLTNRLVQQISPPDPGLSTYVDRVRPSGGGNFYDQAKDLSGGRRVWGPGMDPPGGRRF